MTTERLTFASRDGLELEGEADAPADATATVVVCHPHPKMGGTMNAPLLLALRDAFVGRGWNVLRFNFRGIGASEGESSTGELEVADAGGALDLARSRFGPGPIAVVGWSFGGAVGIRLASTETGLAACVGIAPAIRPKPNVTAGLPPASEIRLACPTLLLVGANDDLVSPADVEAWAGEVGADHQVLAGANHFFWAKYDDLSDRIAAFLREPLGS